MLVLGRSVVVALVPTRDGDDTEAVDGVPREPCPVVEAGLPERGPGHAGTRLIVGIDEAGYGPRLGPLCVAACGLVVPASVDPGEPVWALLAPVVARSRAGVDELTVPIADSKQLKLASDTVRRHPLVFLERGVLTWARLTIDAEIDDDASLIGHLGAGEGLFSVPSEHRAHRCPWYAGEPAPMPIAHTHDQLAVIRARLSRALDHAHLRPAGLWCEAASEAVFNAMVAELGPKSRVAFRLVGRLLRRAWAMTPSGSGGAPTLVVVDRQGGRTKYASALAGALPDTAIETLDESGEVSAYLVRDPPGDDRAMRIEFRVRAESSSLPVALASMTAKFVRELAMLRFNRWWSAKVEGLKPTAGYATDAGRWLGDVSAALGGHFDDGTRAHLVRRA
ncbi:MAG: hypothetical protein AAGI30_02890 [Planctomycetota bacterium]